MNDTVQNLTDYMSRYSNSTFVNDEIFIELTKKTNEISYLKEHRDFIEKNKLGFGDRAFHYMWWLILKHLHDQEEKIEALEIGVFKGQVISLWSLISKNESLVTSLTGISPLQGNPTKKNKILNKLYTLFSRKYRSDGMSGNHYEETDYLKIIKSLFEKFKLDFNTVELHKGYSNSPRVLSDLHYRTFNLIYIDGDHSYEGVCTDLKNFCSKIRIGGLLIMDDASCNLPGTSFWKGHQSVSDACELINKDEFANVLNVGHNRIYKRIS